MVPGPAVTCSRAASGRLGTHRYAAAVPRVSDAGFSADLRGRGFPCVDGEPLVRGTHWRTALTRAAPDTADACRQMGDRGYR